MDRRVHVPLYGLLVLLITAVGAPGISIGVSYFLSERAIATVREQDRQQTCIEHGAVITVLRDSSRLTGAGRGLLATYEELYARNRCEEDPPR